MGRQKRDHSMDLLLELDGQFLVIVSAGKHWVKFVVQKVKPSPERPHGINYSLTLHDEKGKRLVGFDNAHPVSSKSGPGKKIPKEFDHKHRVRSVKPYEYSDAASLLADFWAEVDQVLKGKGIIQ